MYSSTAYLSIIEDDNQANKPRHWTPITLSQPFSGTNNGHISINKRHSTWWFSNALRWN